jgi:hypothetical protein
LHNSAQAIFLLLWQVRFVLGNDSIDVREQGAPKGGIDGRLTNYLERVHVSPRVIV